MTDLRNPARDPRLHWNWRDTLIVLAVCMAITLGVFWAWLGVQFPWGVFENFM